MPPSSELEGNFPLPQDQKARQLYQTIREQIPRQEFDTWFRTTPCSFKPPGTFVLTTPNRFRKAWIKNEFAQVILSAAKSVCAATPHIVFEVARSPGHSPRAGAEPVTLREELRPSAPGGVPATHRLNREFTLRNFVVGPGSRVAHAAATAVAEYPGKTYNPLYVYGPSGSGKTHLLQGISGHLALTSNLRQIYVSTEEFTNHFIRCAESKDLESFRSHYRSTDVLLVDDIDFLVAKTRTQEEFFHCFNSLISENRQVVLSSNCSPADMRGVSEHLAARFRWGLVAHIEPATAATKATILLAKAQQRGFSLSTDTAEFLAEHVEGSLHELEGAFTRMVGIAQVHQCPLTRAMAELALQEISGDKETPRRALTIDTILAAVQDYYGLKAKELLARSKVRPLVLARQVGMYLARKMTPLSLEQIGSRFGGRDHTTVLYAQQRIDSLLRTNTVLRTDVQLIRRRIESARAR